MFKEHIPNHPTSSIDRICPSILGMDRLRVRATGSLLSLTSPIPSSTVACPLTAEPTKISINEIAEG